MVFEDSLSPFMRSLRYLPSNVPGLRAFLHHGPIRAHIEDILQTLKLRLVREKLAVRRLAVIQRFEK